MLTPLADRLRPKTLADFVGQEHLIGPHGLLRKMIDSDQLVSMIFWGPPGSGKTTLAQIIANATKNHFVMFSAVTNNLADLRKIVEETKERLDQNLQKTVLFVDEIHRFSKAQQDAFLPIVEKGTIILIGATTENPSFEVIGPLLSRCKVLLLNQLNNQDLSIICERGLKELKISLKDDAKNFLIEFANGDARVVLNTLEIAKIISRQKKINLLTVQEALQSKLLYDRLGEEHYNTISAFIKSMRAGNVDASLYYLARMVEAGEDPLFIARRMVVFASEDVASPTALVVANAVFAACQQIGYPECQENLAAGTVYLAKASKDRSSYNAYMQALSDVKRYGNLPIPLNLRNAPTKLMKEIGYGKGYEQYTKEDLFPEKLRGRKYF
ncbi:MAG: replication-associated recombination protein A [Patescibacteria group bacterium]|nr:replication-associated recombination protein A [Patescibacteria group bacterium]